MIDKGYQNDNSVWNSRYFQVSGSSVIWVSLFIVLAICFIDLSGTIFNLHLLKNLEPWWIHMKVTTILCLGLVVIALIIILTGKPARFRALIPNVIGIIIVSICLLTIGVSLLIYITGNEPDILKSFPLSLFLGPETGMSLVLSTITLFIGCIIILIASDTPRTSNVAHVLLLPTAITSYFFPVTYFLGVYSLNEVKFMAIGLSTGIALCLACIAILFMRPNTWLMAVFTSKNLGGIMARKLLPALMILPLVIGWLRISGEKSELFKSEFGVALVAIVYTLSFIMLVWMSAKSVNKTSEKLKLEIEEHKKTEKLLENNRVHLERSQEIAHLGSWELDIENNLLIWSDEVYRIFGLFPGEFNATYEAFLAAVHPDDRAAVDNAFSNSLKGNKDSYEIEHRIIRKKSGETRYVHEKCEHFRDNSGQVIRSVGMVHDITSRKQAEIGLRESEEKLNIALDHGNIGIWEWNLFTDEVILDYRMEKMFGLEPGTFGGTFYDFENLLNEEDIPHFKKAISNALNEDVPFETILRVRVKNEEDRCISVKAKVQRDNLEDLAKMMGVCFDITDMKRGTEQLLFDLNEKLLRSNNELEQFAYIASHDLQEPLRMISSFTQLLSMKYKDKLDQEAQEYIAFAANGALRLQNQINDLLTLSRIQTKGKEFSKVNMNIVLEQAIKNLVPCIQEKKAEITNARLSSIFADKGQMVQLMQNLIGNALKYCKETPKIHISSEEKGDYDIISVRDNGIGIEPQYIDRIFQIFQRLHSMDEYDGCGIGLAICKRIVQRHNGKIWVESDFGKGSTFYFSIPRLKIQEASGIIPN